MYFMSTDWTSRCIDCADIACHLVRYAAGSHLPGTCAVTIARVGAG